MFCLSSVSLTLILIFTVGPERSINVVVMVTGLPVVSLKGTEAANQSTRSPPTSTVKPVQQRILGD